MIEPTASLSDDGKKLPAIMPIHRNRKRFLKELCDMLAPAAIEGKLPPEMLLTWHLSEDELRWLCSQLMLLCVESKKHVQAHSWLQYLSLITADKPTDRKNYFSDLTQVNVATNIHQATSQPGSFSPHHHHGSTTIHAGMHKLGKSQIKSVVIVVLIVVLALRVPFKAVTLSNWFSVPKHQNEQTQVIDTKPTVSPAPLPVAPSQTSAVAATPTPPVAHQEELALTDLFIDANQMPAETPTTHLVSTTPPPKLTEPTPEQDPSPQWSKQNTSSTINPILLGHLRKLLLAEQTTEAIFLLKSNHVATSLQAHYVSLLTDELLKKHRTKQAETWLDGFSDQLADHVAVMTSKAKIALQQQKIDQALDILKTQHLQSIGDYPEYFATLAYAYLKKKQFNESALVYQDLVTYDSQSAMYWAGLGFAYRGLQLWDKSKFALNQAFTLSHDYRLKHYLMEQIQLLSQLAKSP